jgi:hypothetical protein
MKSYHSMAVPIVAATTARRSWRRWSCALVATANTGCAMVISYMKGVLSAR